MVLTITLPDDYGYVITTTVATFFLGLWHGMNARPYRTKAGMKHPKAFAESSDFAAATDAEQKKTLYLFNCAQRAHANYVENQPSTAIALLLAGLRYPRLSALFGVIWMIGRIIFTLGYCSREKENGSGRVMGFVIQFPMQLGLWGLAAWTGISMLP